MRISDWSSDVCSSDLPAFPVSSAIHALGAGAMAAMTLAVMTRATRGHTGRPLEVDRATVAIYFLVHVGALLRVIAPLLPVDYMGTIHLAGGLWGAAFVLFLLDSGPMALRDRKSVVEGKSVSVSVELVGRRINKKQTTQQQQI